MLQFLTSGQGIKPSLRVSRLLPILTQTSSVAALQSSVVSKPFRCNLDVKNICKGIHRLLIPIRSQLAFKPFAPSISDFLDRTFRSRY